ncbi:MAG: cobalt/nickel transport system permease protein [Tepidanaerobacteraceae bacterium]|nr:cobalt/nickel transport system permease protein [Tepidanaerobacteraceae bacterium]
MKVWRKSPVLSWPFALKKLYERVNFMHIPDGFLDAKTIVTTAVISAYAIKKNVEKTRKILGDRDIPVMGVMAAFIFAAQMVNFPVMAGTSGHLLGAALATTLLGPYSAGLIMATVLIVQSIFFQDGGLLALGANILNMAVVAPMVSYFVFAAIKRSFHFSGADSIASFAAAWFSVVTASVFASLELALSGTAALKMVLVPMVAVHALIGVGEGLITTAAVAYIGRVLNLKADAGMKYIAANAGSMDEGGSSN